MWLLVGCGTQSKHHERYYQERVCEQMHGQMEHRLFDATRVDCLTSEYAIEVDFSEKWAQSVGQALYYAKISGKKPAVALIVDESKREQRHLKRLRVLARSYGISVFKIEKEE
jgi:hypothetical protein